jgi:hypothetical protein
VSAFERLGGGIGVGRYGQEALEGHPADSVCSLFQGQTGHRDGAQARDPVFGAVTPLVTIPVAFVCYPPDPAYRQWSRRRKQL